MCVSKAFAGDTTCLCPGRAHRCTFRAGGPLSGPGSRGLQCVHLGRPLGCGLNQHACLACLPGTCRRVPCAGQRRVGLQWLPPAAGRGLCGQWVSAQLTGCCRAGAAGVCVCAGNDGQGRPCPPTCARPPRYPCVQLRQRRRPPRPRRHPGRPCGAAASGAGAGAGLLPPPCRAGGSQRGARGCCRDRGVAAGAALAAQGGAGRRAAAGCHPGVAQVRRRAACCRRGGALPSGV